MIQPSLFKAKSEWCTPTEFPDLSQYEEIAIDLETKDPDLTKKGSCSTRGGGDVVGIAVAVKRLVWLLSQLLMRVVATYGS